MVTYRGSKVFDAPIKYVFEWATDFTESDNTIWGGKIPRIILFKTKNKAVYASHQQGLDGKEELAVGIVTMNPLAYSWHLDYYAEEDSETGDYKLTRLSKSKTRLDMLFKNKWKDGKGPSVKDFEKQTKFLWEKYGEALEKDYNSGKKAKSLT